MPHVATHFWLFEQCERFPVMGGEYSWPWTNLPILSPHRHMFNYYDKFLSDNSITGIGNMLSHSLEANLLFIKNNLLVLSENPTFDTDATNIPSFKQALTVKLGFPKPECRMKNYGWEMVDPEIVNIRAYKNKLTDAFGVTTSTITWNNKVAHVLGGQPSTNGRYL